VSNSSWDFIDLIQDEHGVYIPAEELRELQIELFSQAQQSKLKPYYGPIEIRQDKILMVVGFGILGAFFLPGLLAGVGTTIGWVGGALLGASIGYRLANAFDGSGVQTQQDIKSQSVFVFGGTPELVQLGSPVPAIYCNDTNNSYVNSDGVTEGGLFIAAQTIYSKIAPTLGSQILTKLAVIGGGKIAEVNQATSMIDELVVADFGSDITTAVTDGSYTQGSLGGITDYCQAASQNTNSYLGIGAAVTAEATAWTAATTITAQNLVNATFTTGTLLKTAGAAAWDAGGRSQALALSTVSYGDFVEVTGRAGQLATAKAIGISTANTTANLADMDFAVVLRADNKYEIFVGNVSQFVSAASYTTANVFALRLYNAYPTNYLQVLVDNAETWRATTSISGSVFGDYSLFTAASSLTNLQARAIASTPGYVATDFLPGIGRRFMMSAGRLDLFKNTAIYTNVDAGDVKAVAKNPTAGWVEFDRAIWVSELAGATPLAGQGMKGGGKLYPRYSVLLKTSKAVQRLELVILANLDARASDNGLLQFGVAFEISMSDGGAYQTLGRLMISAKSASQLYRSILIGNLPKKVYQIKIRPLVASEITANITAIGEAGNIQTASTAANFGLGSVTWAYDQSATYIPADAQVVVDPAAGGKIRTAAEQGAVARVTHINEIVVPASTPTYPGYTVAMLKATASDRLQSAPNNLWDVRKGRLCRNHLATGTATSTSNTGRVDDVTAHFLDDGVVVGCTVRVLEQGSQRIVTAATQNSLTCQQYTATATQGANAYTLTLSAANPSLLVGMPVTGTGIPAGTFIESIASTTLILGDGWGRLVSAAISPATTITINGNAAITPGDRYAVWSMAASNYLPDVAIDRLINPIDGLGGLVTQDWFIHYPSMVQSRKFCQLNGYFYDGVVDGGSFEQWLTRVASSSLLYPTKIEGQYALIPEQNEPVKAIFNAANLIDYSEPYTEWQYQIINTILVKFTDKRKREQQRKIQTTAASTGAEAEIVKTIDLEGVTNPAQAISVGCVALKSLRIQNRVCKFTTDYANLTCIHGDIIRTQHATVEYTDEKSGIVLAAQPPTNSRTATTGTIATITKTLPGSGGITIIYCSQPHNLADGDTVSITGHSSSPLNAALVVDIYDDLRFSVPIAYAAGMGGNIAKRRTIKDQIVKLSEQFAIGGTTRISIGHRPMNCELELQLTGNPDGTVTILGIEKTIAVGDLFIVGQSALLDRTWRISTLKPMISENKAEITAVVWDNSILSQSGLVIT
jgi:hypothetical protein